MCSLNRTLRPIWYIGGKRIFDRFEREKEIYRIPRHSERVIFRKKNRSNLYFSCYCFSLFMISGNLRERSILILWHPFSLKKLEWIASFKVAYHRKRAERSTVVGYIHIYTGLAGFNRESCVNRRRCSRQRRRRSRLSPLCVCLIYSARSWGDLPTRSLLFWSERRRERRELFLSPDQVWIFLLQDL